ncbi:MAG: phage portal protein [Planctomycetota bacterium]
MSSLLDLILPGVAASRAEARLRATRARARARATERAVEVAEQHYGRRRYEAAARGRRTDGWRTSPSSAVAEIGPALALLRDRSRDLVRNNPWAKKAIGVHEARTVGTGIVPTPAVPDGAASGLRRDGAELAARWKGWAETTECDAAGRTNLYGLQALAQRSVGEAGEALVRRRWRRTSDGLTVPLQLQLLEPDHLDLSKTEPLKSGNHVLQGVEFNKIGRRVAYWMHREHPGGSIYGLRTRSYGEPVRVPASEVLHIFRSERIGQVRGVPWGASCLLKLRDFDDYDDATLLRQKIAACFAAFVRDIDSTIGEDSSLQKDASGRRIDEIEPGMVQELGPGQDVTFSSPPPAMGFRDYSEITLHAIAAGYGVTYEALSGDLSRVNFSSGRMGWLEMEAAIRTWRRNEFIPQFCQGVWGWFLDGALLAGHADARVPARWTPPRREMLDPLKEVKALREAVRSGFTSLSDALRSLGHDPEEVLEELKSDLDLLDKLGIELDSDPRKGGAATAGGQGERGLAGALCEAVLGALEESAQLGDDPGGQ